MPNFDSALISRIQQANDIVDVVAEHLALKRKGREMVGLCPFHEDHKPSLNVNPHKQIFKCFACGAGGDVVKFVQMREGLSFPQALQRLADRAGITIEQRRHQASSIEHQASSIDPNALARVNAWAAKYFAANLNHNEKGADARCYLQQRHFDFDIIKKWQIGLALSSNNDLLTSAQKKNIPVQLLLAAGLVTGAAPSLADKFVNRLMFTITDVTGRVIGFGGRTLTGDNAKYINSPATPLFDKSNSLFGLDLARHQIVAADTAILVEGYTDCIMAHQFGLTNVVATLGTSFTAGHARILRRYARKIVLLFDSDVAGLEAANRALQVALASRIDIAIANVPEGKDPCDFLIAKGKEPFEKIIEIAVDVFKFKWKRLTETLGSQPTIAGKKQAVDDYLEAIATAIAAGNLSAIEKGLIINHISTIIALEPKEINNDLNRRITRAKSRSAYPDSSAPSRTAPVSLGSGLSAAAQREILEVLLANPALFPDVQGKISPKDFDVPSLNKIADALFRTLTTTPDAAPKDICAAIEEPELAGAVITLADAGEQKQNFEKRLDDSLSTLEKFILQKNTPGASPGDKNYIQDIYKRTPKQDPRNIGMT